ncbi:Gfo/Idh/MocA family protein [Rhodopirellula sp. SWK7]|uniref:Gfo/Idh/MocA family protein n=1 Tax=Rhodopirellula sp. SWK7 TaxID=595460 RepID=UPI00034C333F|nr:Gfo/Idh/MocA family oxidoreductase [Rhodopirellula sp. SWK7]
MKTNKLSRRRAIQVAASSIAIPYFVPNTVLGSPTRAGANDRVRIGLIGLGARCRSLAQDSLAIPDVEVAAVCDCFAPRVDSILNDLGKDQSWTGYTDFRKMIENEDLDGVMVETTTHARAWVACHAMAMGMDAYIEKPMALTIAEGRHMVNIARKYNRVTQIGTQQRSIPLNNWASDLVQDGAIGKINVVMAPNFVGPVEWTPKPGQPLPAGGDEGWWDVWTNQAEMRPYHAELQYGWNRWASYDRGGRCFGVTGWGTHSYDQIQRGLGTSETGPAEIVLDEPVRVEDCGKFDPRKSTDDETGAQYYNMAKNVVGPRGKVTMRYANGTELRLHLDGDWGPGLGCIFIGEKGKIEINRDKVAANPRRLVTGSDNPGHLTVSENTPHIRNWVDCIKTRERCNADIEYGQRSSSLCYLVNIARAVGRVGEPLKWDPTTERFTNCDEGNALLSRTRRAGYELPT